MSSTEETVVSPESRVAAVDAAIVPVRSEYEQVKAARRAVLDQIAELMLQEKDLILQMNKLGDQLETLRLERQSLLGPPKPKRRRRA